MSLITRHLKNGRILTIDHVEGMLLQASIDGVEVATGGIGPIPSKMREKFSGFTAVACSNVPVTRREQIIIQAAIDAGRAEINKAIEKSRAYNDLMNEGGEGYTPGD